MMVGQVRNKHLVTACAQFAHQVRTDRAEAARNKNVLGHVKSVPLPRVNVGQILRRKRAVLLTHASK